MYNGSFQLTNKRAYLKEHVCSIFHSWPDLMSKFPQNPKPKEQIITHFKTFMTFSDPFFIPTYNE